MLLAAAWVWAMVMLCCAWKMAFMATDALAVVPFIWASNMTVLLRLCSVRLVTPWYRSSAASATSLGFLKSTCPKHAPCRFRTMGTATNLTWKAATEGSPPCFSAWFTP